MTADRLTPDELTRLKALCSEIEARFDTATVADQASVQGLLMKMAEAVNALPALIADWERMREQCDRALDLVVVIDRAVAPDLEGPIWDAVREASRLARATLEAPHED